MSLVGWAAGDEKNDSIEIKVFDSNQQEIAFSCTRGQRPDVGMALFWDSEDCELGFFLEIPYENRGVITVEFSAKNEKNEVYEQRSEVIGTGKIQRQHKLGEIREFWEEPQKKLNKVRRKLLNSEDREYRNWFDMMRATSWELADQRKAVFEHHPKFSILVPVYHTPLSFLRDMIQSVIRQSYGNWELCIVNASPEESTLTQQLDLWMQNDGRIRVKQLERNLGIAENSNEALRMATGEFIAMLDHDDMLEPNALYEYVKRLNEKPKTDIFYCDEDKITEHSNAYFYPHFKSDFNIDLLRCNNYLCHFLAVRTSLANEVGGWSSEYDGAQDYDFILKCVEKTANIEHISKVLYHWRCHPNSTAKQQENKKYAFDAGAAALNAHYNRVGISAAAKIGSVYGWYESEYKLSEHPLVSVLIPNKDHSDDLDVCIRSLMERCTYKELEVIVIENNSTDSETFEYYQKVQKRYDNVKVVCWESEKGFNYSAINNFGFQYAAGDYILLLNNDVEVITENVIESMLGYCMRPEVGIVGARLLYQDNTVQHAGVIVGAGGLADHAFKGLKDSDEGYMCRSISTQNLSAVTAACLMVKRSVYEEVGGLDETFEVAFNDIDFCLKVREAGYLIVYDAQAKLHHYESKSRGVEDTPKRFVRFDGEMVHLRAKWKIVKEYVDPYYNPNLSNSYEYYKINRLALEKRKRQIARERKKRWTQKKEETI